MDEEESLHEKLFDEAWASSDDSTQRHEEALQWAIEFLQGKEHVWCEHVRLASEVLVLFTEDNLDRNERIRCAFACCFESLQLCCKCVRAYHRGVQLLKERITVARSAEVAKSMLGELVKLDARRVLRSLDFELTAAPGDSIAGPLFFEIFAFPELLDDEQISRKFAEVFPKRASERAREFAAQWATKLPGIFLAMLSRNVGVRCYADAIAKELKKVTLAEYDSVQCVFDRFYVVLERDDFGPCAQPRSFTTDKKEFWVGFVNAISYLSRDVLAKRFISSYQGIVGISINNLVDEQHKLFWPAVSCLNIFLEALSFGIWSVATSFSPLNVVKTLIEECRRSSNDDKARTAIFRLFVPFVVSLQAWAEEKARECCQAVIAFLSEDVQRGPLTSYSLVLKIQGRKSVYAILDQCFESGIAPLESFIEKCHAMVATDLSSPEQHISEPASNVVACVVRHGVRLVKQSFWEAAPVSHSFVHPSTHFALPFHDSGGGKRRFEVIWSAIFRAIHGAPVTPHILREIFQSHAELCALSSAGHRGAAVAQFRSWLSKWLAVARCGMATIKEPEIAATLFSFLILPVGDPVQIEFNNFFHHCCGAPETKRLMAEIVSEQPQSFLRGICSVFEQIDLVGVKECYNFWGNLLFWLNASIEALVGDSATDVLASLGPKLWPVVTAIMLAGLEEPFSSDRDAMVPISIRLFDFLATLVMKAPAIFEEEVKRNPSKCQACKCSSFSAPVPASPACKCGHPESRHSPQPEWIDAISQWPSFSKNSGVPKRLSICVVAFVQAFTTMDVTVPKSLRQISERLLADPDLLSEVQKATISTCLAESKAAPMTESRPTELAASSRLNEREIVLDDDFSVPLPPPARGVSPQEAKAVPSPVVAALPDEDEEESEQQSILDELARDSCVISEKERAKASAVRQPHRAVVMIDGVSPRVSRDGRPVVRRGPPRSDKEIAANLLKIALTWDFFGIEPHEEKLQRVPTSFENSDEYVRVFRPLILRELDAQIQQGKIENDEPTKFQLSRQDVGSEGDFTLVSFAFRDEVSELPWVDNDLLLLEQHSSEAGHHKQRVNALAKVERFTINTSNFRGRLLLKLYLPRLSKEDTTPYAERLRNVERQLSKGQLEWVARKVANMATVTREWVSLFKCGDLPLSRAIFSPFARQVQIGTPQRDLHDFLAAMLHSSGLNRSQLEAVRHSITGEGFRLVQGPPGTGKSFTVLAILSALLASAENSMSTKSSFGSPALTALVENRRHVMVCAPSNAAIDEIAARILKSGLRDSRGGRYDPKIIRVGVPSTNPELQKIGLEELVAKELEENTEWASQQSRYKEIEKATAQARESLVSLQKEISEKSEELQAKKDLPEADSIRARLTQLIDHRKAIQDRLKGLNSVSSHRTKHQEEMRKKMTAKLINQSTVICCTLSSAGRDDFSLLTHGFESILIDEAAQAVELSTLIPLKYDVKRCILVGDPAQLPATVLSKEAADCLYEQSLFQRLKECKHEAVMLDTQYRMHPRIREFPSLHFYDGKLNDAPSITESSYHKEFHQVQAFRPFVFYDLDWSSEQRGHTNSTMNVSEAKFCAEIVAGLHKGFPFTTEIGIGVVTPYQQQVHEIRRMCPKSKNVEISTVDGFQGREKDIIVFSCVRAPVSKSIGFLADVRRMNVGLTRAKYALWVVGNSTLLNSNSDWRALIDHARRTNSYLHVPKQSAEFLKKVSTLPAEKPAPHVDFAASSSEEHRTEIPKQIPQPQPHLEEEKESKKRDRESSSSSDSESGECSSTDDDPRPHLEKQPVREDRRPVAKKPAPSPEHRDRQPRPDEGKARRPPRPPPHPAAAAAAPPVAQRRIFPSSCAPNRKMVVARPRSGAPFPSMLAPALALKGQSRGLPLLKQMQIPGAGRAPVSRFAHKPAPGPAAPARAPQWKREAPAMPPSAPQPKHFKDERAQPASSSVLGNILGRMKKNFGGAGETGEKR